MRAHLAGTMVGRRAMTCTLAVSCMTAGCGERLTAPAAVAPIPELTAAPVVRWVSGEEARAILAANAARGDTLARSFLSRERTRGRQPGALRTVLDEPSSLPYIALQYSFADNYGPGEESLFEAYFESDGRFGQNVSRIKARSRTGSPIVEQTVRSPEERLKTVMSGFSVQYRFKDDWWKIYNLPCESVLGGSTTHSVYDLNWLDQPTPPVVAFSVATDNTAPACCRSTRIIDNPREGDWDPDFGYDGYEESCGGGGGGDPGGSGSGTGSGDDVICTEYVTEETYDGGQTWQEVDRWWECT